MTRGRKRAQDDDETPCTHYSARAGIVTNQPEGYDHSRALCSVAVCGDPTCRARSLAYVQKITGEFGTYISDSDRKRSHA